MFIKLFLFILLLNSFEIVHSHFHPIKDFESTLTKCCSIGNDKAIAYQKNQGSSKETSSQDACSINSQSNELIDIVKELKPQCSSIVKLCCTRELNKEICRLSKSFVKERLDSTEFSLNKMKKNDRTSNLINNNIYNSNRLNNDYYDECLPNPNLLTSDNQISKSFAKAILMSDGSQIFSECCIACKLGLFSALNDYKCIIQKEIVFSKQFEETFYDCCINLKKELNLTSFGKLVDIPKMEELIYSELKQDIPFNDMSINKSPKEMIITSFNPLRKILEPSSSFTTPFEPIDSGYLKNLRSKQIENKFLKKPIPRKPDCPKGMHLDEQDSSQCVPIDMCKPNLNNCKKDENCEKIKGIFKCIKNLKKSEIDRKDLIVKNYDNNLSNSYDQIKERPNTLINTNPQIYSNGYSSTTPKPAFYNLGNGYYTTQVPINNQFMPYQHTRQPSYQYSYQYPTYPLPPYNYPNHLAKPNPSYQKDKRRIDKCKIGNHNCNPVTQTCRQTSESFICVNNQDLDEYDRSKSYFFDNSITTTTIKPFNLMNNRSEIFFGIRETNRCPRGSEINLETNQCEDINECELNLHNCESGFRCDNSLGSFICSREFSCGTGYTYNVDTRKCEDINECKLRTDNCVEPYKCVNYEGTFRCEREKCKNGEIWNQNELKCVQIVCQSGFTYNSLTEKCVDVDECIIGIDSTHRNVKMNEKKLEKLSNGKFVACSKDEKCINYSGGYQCQRIEVIKSNDSMNTKPMGRYLNFNPNSDGSRFGCLAGERYDPEERKCIIEKECRIASNANLTYLNLKNFRIKYCNYDCAKVNNRWKCICPKGYRLKRDEIRCEDINECKIDRHNCNLNSQFCVNTGGSYKCIDTTCPAGYVKNVKNALQCVIIDKTKPFTENKPKYISSSFVTIQSNINLKDDGEIRIASIRGANSIDVNFKLLSVTSIKSNFNPNNLAKYEDFELKRRDNDDIYLNRSLKGPQQIKLEFNYTTIQNNQNIVMNRLLLIIDVSEFSF